MSFRISKFIQAIATWFRVALPEIVRKFIQATWFKSALPGIVTLAVIILVSLSGFLQQLEWVTLDFLLSLRPLEPIDERVVIIGIDEEDIEQSDNYPISDREIAKLLGTLQKYQPRVIGLDIVRNIPVEPGHGELVAAFKDIQNLIAVEKVISDAITPPPDLPPEQIGFADVLSDGDGKFRRALLGISRPKGEKKFAFSLPLRLAEIYLQQAAGIELSNGIRDRDAMRFGATELPRFLPNSGGYVGADDFGVQLLLNYRNGRQRFPTLSLRDIEMGEENPQALRDTIKGRIVLIGVTAPSIKDFVNTSAIANLQPPGKIYGVEFHAHIVSQIISAVIDGRPVLKTWAQGWQYLWIGCWGILAIYLGQLTRSPAKNLLYVAVVSFGLVGVSYIFIRWGWWIPVATSLLVLVVNGAILSTFYQYDRFMRSRIELQKQTLEKASANIHSGPLQTLANILRQFQAQDLAQNQLLKELQNLNEEIRQVSEHLKLETVQREEILRLGDGSILDLNWSMQELLYRVYTLTLQREVHCLATHKVVSIRHFDPIEEQYVSRELKREVCQFLEEAICNIAKHAQGVTRIEAKGMLDKKGMYYTLDVQDNGTGTFSKHKGTGTKQGYDLATKLGGKFQREAVAEKGTLCKLTWPLAGRYYCAFGQIKCKIKAVVLKGLKPKFRRKIKAVVLKGLKSKFYR